MKKITRHPFFLAAVCMPLFLAAPIANAQTLGGKGEGLDALDEQRVMGELATYNLTHLLDRDFDLYKVPPAEREQTMTIIKIAELVNGNNLRVAERRALAEEVAKGFNGLLPKLTDPAKLFGYANDLFTSGVTPTVTELEYFGENPISQAQLKPAAETVKKMYAQVAPLATAQANVIGNGIKNAADLDRVRPKLLAMRQLSGFGPYCDNMATYSLCISLPPDDPRRKTLADASIKYLKQFDKPETGVQPQVRMAIGKLQLVSGDFAAAQKTFGDIVKNPGQAIKPAPDVYQKNDARYFGIVAEISSRDLKGAESDIPALETWEKEDYLPLLNEQGQKAVTAALAMLKFRLYSAQSDLTNDLDDKKKFNEQAIDVLAQLLKDQPGLKDLIFDQLIGRIPANPDYASLNPLVLQALQQEGFIEVVKKDGEPFDKAKLTKAIPAAEQLVKLRGKGVDDAEATLSAYFIPYAYMKLGEKKKAAAAFMDFAEKFPKEKARATDSMTNAEALVGELRKADKDDDETRKLYDRFLPMAINPPYGEKRFAYGYASLLFQEKQFKKAVEYYKMVPETEKYYPEAEFSEMLALAQELPDTTIPADEHKQMVTEILDLAKKIDGLFTDAKDETAKKKYLEWVVVADQIAADLSRRELHDPAKSLEILTGFEEKIKGAKDEKTADLNAMRLRVSDYIDLGKVDEATRTLQKLLVVNPAAGAALLNDVLKAVRRDKDAAQVAGNMAEVKTLAADQAILSGFMLAAVEKDPKLSARVPEFRLYDANSKREAAELVDDPAARKSGLEAALKQYQLVFNQHVNEGDDLAAQQGMGLCQYDLGDYAAAVTSLAPLVKKLAPTETVMVNGISETRENGDFWEANYKLFRSALELFKAKPHDAEAKDIAESARTKVLNQFIIFGPKTGGAKYHDDYAKLKEEMLKAMPPPAGKPAAPAAAPVKSISK
jgi:hypothetical protein